MLMGDRVESRGTLPKTLLLSLATLCFGLAVVGNGPAEASDQEEIAELKAHIRSLQRRVADLEARQTESEAVGGDDQTSQNVTLGDFPGSLKLPESDLSFKIGGYVKLDFIHDLDYVRTGDLFVQTAIPVDGDDDAGRSGETRLTARQSRVNLDVRAATQLGLFRGFTEGDFFGSGSTFQLRHAYVELGHLLAGQTWSTFMDITAWPEILGFEGPDVAVFARQAQVRWTQPVTNELTLALGLEDPSGDFTDSAGGVDSKDALNQWPDLTSHLRLQDFWGHLQLGGLVRQIQFDDGVGQSDNVLGWGMALSGTIYMAGHQDNIQFQATYGDGVGRYIQGFIGTGSDAAPSASGEFEALPAGAAFLSYQHWWTDTLRSSVGGEYGEVDNSAGQLGKAIKNFQGAGVNLVWSIVPRVTLGLQYVWARNEVKDGRDGTARRLQATTQFNFD